MPTFSVIHQPQIINMRNTYILTTLPNNLMYSLDQTLSPECHALWLHTELICICLLLIQHATKYTLIKELSYSIVDHRCPWVYGSKKTAMEKKTHKFSGCNRVHYSKVIQINLHHAYIRTEHQQLEIPWRSLLFYTLIFFTITRFYFQFFISNTTDVWCIFHHHQT